MYDYLVVGAGATGMCFVDVILRRTSKSVLLVDKNTSVGGHWSDHYPYVKLHQNSHTYGIESLELNKDDGKSVKQHFEDALATFRTYDTFSCQLGCTVDFNNITIPYETLVDATYLAVQRLPSKWNMLTPWNVTPFIDDSKKYVVVGGGKTGMDTCIFLVSKGILPDDITWIISDDAVWLKREKINDLGPVPTSIWIANMMNAIIRRVPPWFSLKLDDRIFSLSKNPTRHRCAIIKEKELLVIQQVRKIRKGKVLAKKRNTLIFENNENVSFEKGTLFVNCVQNGAPVKDTVPIFQKNKIVLQPIVMCQPCFSSTTIAKIEVSNKQSLSLIPVKHPKTLQDGVYGYADSMVNLATLKNSCIEKDIFTSRLNQYKN